MTTGGHLGSVDRLLAQRVASTINGLMLEEGDSALSRLAVMYAEAIDAAARGEDGIDVLATLGPKLQSALESLGASPRARALLLKGVPVQMGSKLGAIRAGRG